MTSNLFLVHTVDSDSQCEGDLECFQRDSVEAVPGCYGTGSSGWDYCYKPETPPPTTTKSPTASPTLCPTDGPVLTAQPTGPITYKPGEATTLSEDGYVTLSTGLVAKLIAEAGKKVVFANGDTSSENFHVRPDGAAVFQDDCGGGWTYVSNSEVGGSSTYTGGVGSIYFNALGEVTGYKRIQKNTRVNCSGGKTFWGTWVTCEESGSTGRVLEVHPKGHSNGDPDTRRETLLGRRNGRSGGNYEGVGKFDYNYSVTLASSLVDFEH